MPHRVLGLILICAACFPLARALGAEAISVPLKERPKGKSAPYSPAQATGEPDILAAGDNPQAWAPQQPDGGIEWLALEFEKAVRIESVRIRETNNPGCVTKVVALVDDKEIALFEGEDPSAEAPTDLVIEPGNDVRSKSIKIFIDTRLKPGWEQIDAVELVGKDGSSQWAIEARASSSFGNQARWGAASRSYHPEQATGEPNLADAGDSGQAWTPASMDGGNEWLQVNYRTPVKIAEVRIRESFSPGAIIKVAALAKGDKRSEIVLWEGDETAAGDICDFVVRPEREVESQSIRIYLDPSRVASWPEIDAVELVGKDGKRQWATTASASSSYGSPQGSQDELNALRGRKVSVMLESGKSISGELVRVSARWIVLKTSDRERLINRDRIEVVEPATEQPDKE